MTVMQFRMLGRLLGFSLLTAALVHVGTVWLLPQLTMNAVFELTGETSGYNRIIHLESASLDDAPIPRPDPASAESICAYDLADGPVQLTLPDSRTPATISAVADNTVRFFAAAADGSSTRNIWIATEVQAETVKGEVAISGSSKGLILVRFRATDDDMRVAADAARQQVTCTSVN
jgi:uncharacterized membrane protein